MDPVPIIPSLNIGRLRIFRFLFHYIMIWCKIDRNTVFNNKKGDLKIKSFKVSQDDLKSVNYLDN
ncbi:putative uncharacterized protein [Streptococcus troglodytae]|uniref:Uncharacterized protein n=1 Tax=Streptococcus troglodytae TaxID=1111760 RepID=A0A1L7LIG0_9STRE|nr:putative uncharacterized protein [Streptococcus troglodytae]